MKEKLWTLYMLMLMVLGSCFFAFKPAAAQTGTSVYFSPDPTTLYLNGINSQVVDIMIEGAVDLYGFDIKLTYDANITNIQSVAFGAFFENLYCLRTINEPGFLQYACTQRAADPKSGNGSVLKLTFSGLALGITEITFTQARFSDKDSQPVWPPFTNGTLNVVYDPAIITPTTLSGSFDLQGRTDRGGIPVTLSEAQFVGQGPYTVPTTNVSGNNLAFTNVAMDVYTVSTSQAGYLNISPAMGKQIALLANGNILPPLRLLGGNAIWTDNVIDVYDVDIVGAQWGMSQGDLKPGETLNGDVNFDNIVNIRDWALVAGNYGLSSEDAYADWTP